MDPTELAVHIAQHRRWLESIGREGSKLTLPDADLSGVDLAGAHLAEAILPGARLDHARLVGATLFRCLMHGASLEGADLSGANLAKAVLDEVDAAGAIFDRANMLRCSLHGSDLRGASFVGATSLVKAYFGGADMRGCLLQDVHLDRTFFDNVLLDVVDMTGVTGNFVAGSAIVEMNGVRTVLDAEGVLAHLRRCGADVSFFVPPTR